MELDDDKAEADFDNTHDKAQPLGSVMRPMGFVDDEADVIIDNKQDGNELRGSIMRLMGLVDNEAVANIDNNHDKEKARKLWLDLFRDADANEAPATVAKTISKPN